MQGEEKFLKKLKQPQEKEELGLCMKIAVEVIKWIVVGGVIISLLIGVVFLGKLFVKVVTG